MRTLLCVLLLTLTALACNVDRQPDGTFHVVCWGDSNMEDGWPTGTEVRACGLMPSVLPTVGASSGGEYKILPTRWTNSAQRGAATVEYPTGVGLPVQRAALPADADAVIAAFGTNDAYPFMDLTPQQAIANLRLADEALRAQGIQLWVATAPPSRFPEPLQTWQRTFNALVPQTFCRWVDFTTGFADMLEVDGLHLTPAGQALRAERMQAALSDNRDCP